MKIINPCKHRLMTGQADFMKSQQREGRAGSALSLSHLINACCFVVPEAFLPWPF